LVVVAVFVYCFFLLFVLFFKNTFCSCLSLKRAFIMSCVGIVLNFYESLKLLEGEDEVPVMFSTPAFVLQVFFLSPTLTSGSFGGGAC